MIAKLSLEPMRYYEVTTIKEFRLLENCLEDTINWWEVQKCLAFMY